jgi:peptidoglycan hydrolase-like amidase
MQMVAMTGFVFYRKRLWRHAAGMCRQVGAYGLAHDQGWSSEQILKAYYTGIEPPRIVLRRHQRSQFS